MLPSTNDSRSGAQWLVWRNSTDKGSVTPEVRDIFLNWLAITERVMAGSLTDADIIARCESGSLLADMSGVRSDVGPLLDRCIQLHNAGRLDLLSLTQTEQFSSLSGPGFFDRQQFFCKAIPRLQAQAGPLMRAIQALVEKGGSDLASNLPNDAFRQWCEAEPERARAIISAARENDALSGDFVTFAFRALGDPSLPRSFIADYTDKRRLAALFTLGRISHADSSDAEKSIKLLAPFVESEADDAERFNALASLIEICSKFPEHASFHLREAIVVAAVRPTQNLLFTLARCVWTHARHFDGAAMKAALDGLRAADLTLAGIVHELDNAIVAVLKSANAPLALDFLTEILTRDFDLDRFENTKHELAQGDRDRLFRLAVRWLTSDKLQLGACVSQVLNDAERILTFDTSTAGMNLSPAEHVLLARKAVGWLFIKETIAASMLVACLRGCDDRTSTEIEKLLIDPLLYNYGGSIRVYLESISAEDAAFKAVRSALATADEFDKSSRVVQPIKELRPSEYQRSVERRRSSNLMRQVQKDAEKQSIFMNLVHRSVLLHGRRSLTYVQEPNSNARRPISMDMHSFSYSFELPRSEIADPVGLSLEILFHRTAKLK